MAWWRMPLTGEPGEAVRQVLAALVETGKCDYIYTPQMSAKGPGVTASFVAGTGQLGTSAAAVPAMMVNSAQVLASVAARSGTGKIAAVVRSCEVRALVELAKLKQVCLDNLLLIGIDCTGTLDPKDFRSAVQELGIADVRKRWWQTISAGKREHEGLPGVRQACRVCVNPEANNVAIRLGIIGADDDYMLVQLPDEDNSLAGVLNLTAAQEQVVSQRSLLLDRLVEAARQEREQLLASGAGSVDDLLTELAGCIRCLNCRRACPICYCRECAFETMLFEHDPDQYQQWAGRKGAVRLPADTTLFHLTRMNHVGPSCVGCGLCEMACPSEIPLTKLFIAAADDVQQLFKYEAGRDRDEPLPYTTFEEQELEPR